MRPTTLARLGEFGFQSYEAYLASDLWKKNRARANLLRRCWICGTDQFLQFHHRSYENICNEHPDDLIMLCGDHHQEVHKLVSSGIPLYVAHIKCRKTSVVGQQNSKVQKRDKKRRHRTSQCNPCPNGVPEDLWYNCTARIKALSSPSLELLRREKRPMSSEEIANVVCPGLNAGRMGEVMKVLRQRGKVIKTHNMWVAR